MDQQVWRFLPLIGGLQLLIIPILYIHHEKWRRTCAGLLIVIFSPAVSYTLLELHALSCVLLAYFFLFQAVNFARVVENRMHLNYLRMQVLKSGVIFLMLITFSPLLQPLVDYVLLNNVAILRLGGVVVLIGAAAVFWVTLWHVFKTKPLPQKKFYTDAELPTVSVLIPARNEDSELTECIHSILKNDYEKLEVIVLDDCSQDSSSDIVKRFAHQGVRFIQGDPPKDNWLAKNQAYETLANAASGEILLFMGVDVRLNAQTIRAMASRMLTEKLAMISVLPRRGDQTALSSLLFPLRYWWEMAIPRNIFRRPSVLSTCWMIKKDALKHNGGFSALSRAVIPESYLARDFYAKKQYRFIRSDHDIAGVITNKVLAEQYNTAIRTRYPQLHKRLEGSAMLILAMVVFWLWPFMAVLAAIFHVDVGAIVLYLSAAGLLVASHITILLLTSGKGAYFGLLNFPYLVAQEIILLLISIYKYEFSEVIWKGRNVCYPVMHVTPRLPEIEARATRKAHSS